MAWLVTQQHSGQEVYPQELSKESCFALAKLSYTGLEMSPERRGLSIWDWDLRCTWMCSICFRLCHDMHVLIHHLKGLGRACRDGDGSNIGMWH